MQDRITKYRKHFIFQNIINTTKKIQVNCLAVLLKASSSERPLVAHTTVNITVLDANDNCPIFINLPYRTTLMANASKGDFVFRVMICFYILHKLNTLVVKPWHMSSVVYYDFFW